MEYNLQGTKEDVLYWAKRLYQKNMSPAKSGNISIRVKDGILISSSGVCLNDMSVDDVVLIDYDGNIKQGNKKPSSEKIMHSEIYTLCDEIKAIIHCHDPLITAFAVSNNTLKKPILPDFALMYDEIPLIPYFCPGTIELAQAVAQSFQKCPVAILKNHGIILGSNTLQNAFYELESLRSYVEIYFGAEVLGGACALSKKDVTQIRKLYLKN